ncbi:unnamed protein product [Rhodiola kirilowii]
MALQSSPSGESIVFRPPPPPPPPPALSSSSSADSQRHLPTPFLIKTYQLVDDISINSIVSWNEDGTGFVIWNPAEFARLVLPKNFKHNNFSSFVRQLNTYGFRKIMPDRWEFSNDCFRRGDKRLLCDIVRRKLTAAVSGASSNIIAFLPAPMEPSTSNSGEGQVFLWNSTPTLAAPTDLMFVDQSNCQGNDNSCSSSRAHLIDENDRLKKKNTQLYKELSHMKSMCTNIFSMMSNYNPGSGPLPGMGHGPGPPMPGAVVCGSNNSSQAESMMIPLHLMSGPILLAAIVETQAIKAAEERLSLNPSLFGYQLGSKRARVEDREQEGTKQEQDDLLQLQQPGSSLSR